MVDCEYCLVSLCQVMSPSFLILPVLFLRAQGTICYFGLCAKPVSGLYVKPLKRIKTVRRCHALFIHLSKLFECIRCEEGRPTEMDVFSASNRSSEKCEMKFTNCPARHVQTSERGDKSKTSVPAEPIALYLPLRCVVVESRAGNCKSSDCSPR